MTQRKKSFKISFLINDITFTKVPNSKNVKRSIKEFTTFILKFRFLDIIYFNYVTDLSVQSLLLTRSTSASLP
ncbi:hypothetical protein HanXRQr2_Chr13g0603091 [Helianthus annuus]|uniref:Uncharacterized protein n=1 Tax=Helianthus annuus TaxID=4232 RepID=A0A9K3EJT7_HELAN|nr:hypothetical protein HanXRQr2_Chr13g0603091 [Helianthus annuus]KAJ0850461.1 hypothetical protein HanPSC8_Chr13g0581101 [Helianthus annuus]